MPHRANESFRSPSLTARMIGQHGPDRASWAPNGLRRQCADTTNGDKEPAADRPAQCYHLSAVAAARTRRRPRTLIWTNRDDDGPTGDGLCRTAGLAFRPFCSATDGALLFNKSAPTRIRFCPLDRTLDIVAIPREATLRSAMIAATCAGIAGDIKTPPPADAAASDTNSNRRIIVLKHLSFDRRHPDTSSICGGPGTIHCHDMIDLRVSGHIPALREEPGRISTPLPALGPP